MGEIAAFNHSHLSRCSKKIAGQKIPIEEVRKGVREKIPSKKEMMDGEGSEPGFTGL